MRRAALVLATIALAGCARERIVAPPELERPRQLLAGATQAAGWIVVFTTEDAVPADFGATVADLGATIRTMFDGAGVASVGGLTGLTADLLRAAPGVESVTRDLELNWLPNLRVGGAIDDEHFPHEPGTVPWWDRQWGLRQIQADLAWATGVTGTPAVRVGILDTGVDYGHVELAGQVDTALSRSFIEDDPVLPGDHPVMDYHFHGTHVSGIVAGNAFRTSGVAPHVRLVGVKVLSFQGSGTFEGVMAGIHYAASIPVDVINMSLGAMVPRDDPEVQELVKALTRTIRFAERQGTIVISAAGNDAADLDDRTIMSTPCEQSTLCVSATGPLLQQNFDQPASYTNFGARVVDAAAPGGNFDPVNGQDQTEDLVISACSRRTTQPTLAPCLASVQAWYVWAAGTSMAAPHVAGVAALIDSKYGGLLNANGLKSRILEGAEDLGPPGKDAFYGQGRVNAYRSVLQ